MRKKTVLCEVAFWKKFSECYPSLMPFPDERAIENLKCWMELYSFLFRSDVHFDCSDKQFIELAEADERLRYLWKKSAGGECGIDFSEESFDSSYLEGSPLSVLFSESDRHIDASRREWISPQTRSRMELGRTLQSHLKRYVELSRDCRQLYLEYRRTVQKGEFG